MPALPAESGAVYSPHKRTHPLTNIAKSLINNEKMMFELYETLKVVL